MAAINRKNLVPMTPDRSSSPYLGKRRARIDPSTASPKRGGSRTDRTVAEIERLARQRDERRKSADEAKRRREEEIRQNERNGRPGDVDFQRMISKFREDVMNQAQPHAHVGELQINVVVRKRPTNALEIRRKDHDSVSCSNPMVYVHDCKLRVDGITKYLDNTTFCMDHAFDENATNDVVYENTAKSLVEFTMQGGRSTCFAYGQTGSGKTYTMAGVQALAARDVFRLINSPQHVDKNLSVYCSFFELYGGRCIDLLNERRICAVREDGKGRVCVDGLREEETVTEDEILDIITMGNSIRTTHQTEMNDVSSRSHAICQIQLRLPGRRSGELGPVYGKLSLIDLAGSERGQDTKHHDRQRRAESAEINKSLLALKECIRALGTEEKKHVPYRGSKLTMVLKDSFDPNSRTVMISCVSPAASSADHTLNTLRYADRVKEKCTRPEAIMMSARKGTDVEYAAATEDHIDNSPGTESSSDTVDEVRQGMEESPMSLKSVDEPTLPPTGSNWKHTPLSDKVKSRKQWDKQRPDIITPSRGNRRPSAVSNDDGRGNSMFESPGRDLKLLRNNIKGQQNSGSSGNTDSIESHQNKYQARNGKKGNHGHKQRGHRNDRNANQSQNSVSNSKQVLSKNASEASLDESTEILSFHKLVSALVDEEEMLLKKHMECIQSNADWLTEEGELLAKVQGDDVVDFDIDEYATKLDGILVKKMDKLQDLHALLSRFREHLRQEEEVSSRMDGLR